MKTQLFALTVVVLMLVFPGGICAQETDPVEMITAWNDAQNAGDADAALAFFAADAFITLVPPPMEGHDGVFRGKEEIRAWWENLYALNGASTVSNCQVEGETVTCLLNYTDDSLKALGLDSIDNEFVVTVREGKIQTYTATMTEESLAALMAAMAAMSPQSLAETGGTALPSYAVLAILGGLIGISGFGLKALRWRRRNGG
jgi:ketosteroid isomerase-like protein